MGLLQNVIQMTKRQWQWECVCVYLHVWDTNRACLVIRSCTWRRKHCHL